MVASLASDLVSILCPCLWCPDCSSAPYLPGALCPGRREERGLFCLRLLLPCRYLKCGGGRSFEFLCFFPLCFSCHRQLPLSVTFPAFFLFVPVICYLFSPLFLDLRIWPTQSLFMPTLALAVSEIRIYVNIPIFPPHSFKVFFTSPLLMFFIFCHPSPMTASSGACTPLWHLRSLLIHSNLELRFSYLCPGVKPLHSTF